MTSAGEELAGAREINVHLASWVDPDAGIKRWLPITVIDGRVWDIPCGHGGHTNDASARKCSGLRKTWKFVLAADAIAPNLSGKHPEDQVIVMQPPTSGEVGYARRLGKSMNFCRGGNEHSLYRFSGVVPDIDPEVLYTLQPLPDTVKVVP